MQHTHIKRLHSCLAHVNRILKPNDGFVKVQLPNKNGLRNRLGPVKYERNIKEVHDYDSWCVRYYSPQEYEVMFNDVFGNYQQKTHSFFGIGVLKEDVKYLEGKDKYLSYLSRIATNISNVVSSLQSFSDSLYCMAIKNDNNIGMGESGEAIEQFKIAHAKMPSDNLNIVHLLKCPISGGSLELSENRDRLISRSASVYYPIESEIPIMIESEAQAL